MVPPYSHRIPRVRWYSGYCCPLRLFVYRTLTFCGVLSHTLRLDFSITCAVRTPGILLPLVWPAPLSLATTRGISVDYFSSAYLDVSVRRVPSVYLWIQYTVTYVAIRGVSPFGYPRIYRLFAPPRGFSQLVTSFVGSQCQGIPLVLFLA